MGKYCILDMNPWGLKGLKIYTCLSYISAVSKVSYVATILCWEKTQ